MTKQWMILLMTVTLLASGLAGAKYSLSNSRETPIDQIESHPQPAPSRKVVIERIKPSQTLDIKSYPGTVKATSLARLAFRVGGPLIRMEIKPGDRVKKNQILMEIDPQDFKDKIRVMETQLKGALSQLENGRQDYARIKALFDQKVIPQADFDHARNGVDTLQAAVDGIRAQLTIARHQLGYTSLKAPFDGIITEQFIENYEMVRPGQAVVALHDISILEIEVKMPENKIVSHPLKAGEPGMARFPALAGSKFPVTLKEWNTQADKITRAYAVTFTMPAPKGVNILPGMTAEVTWNGTTAPSNVITVPARAVITDNMGNSVVWIFDRASATARQKSVKVGRLMGTSRIIVKTGLKQGDLIVTQGMNFITRGMKLDTIFADGSASDLQTTETIQ